MIEVPLQTTLPAMQRMGMIDVDATALVSLGIFLVVIVLLHNLLFKPYLALVHERDRLTVGAQGAATATAERATAVLAEYTDKIEAARREAVALREGLRKDAVAEEARIVGDARAAAESTLGASRGRLAAAVATAEAQVETRAASLAQAIVAKVLS